MGREAIFISTRSVVDLQKKVCLFLTVQPALQIHLRLEMSGHLFRKERFQPVQVCYSNFFVEK